MKRVEEHQFNLDFGALKQYFPVNLVVSGIWKICQDLFGNYIMFILLELSISLDIFNSYILSAHLFFFNAGLRFDEIADAEVWHSDVRLYSVYDLSSSELLGYFYLDMFSRFVYYSGFINSVSHLFIVGLLIGVRTK